MDNTRIEIADLLRTMSHQLVGHEVSPDALAEAKASLLQAQQQLLAGQGAERSRDSEHFMNGMQADAQAEAATHQGGGPFGHFTTSIVSGVENPMSYDVALSTEGEKAFGRTTLGPAHEGAPGRAHGGIIAAILDEVMGMIPPMMDSVAFTGWLRVDYLAPCPLGEPLVFKAWCFGLENRKITVKGDARVDGSDRPFASGEGLFIMPKPKNG